jgi:hypothetical protein
LKNTLLFVFIIILGSHFLSAQETWMSFRPIENDFQVLFPDLPETKEKDLHTDELGIIKTVSYNVKFDKKANNFLYSINLVIYPDDTFNEDSTDYNLMVLKNSVDEMSRLLKCPIVYVGEEFLGTRPALSYRLMDELSGQVVKGFIVRNQDTIYTLSVFTLKDKSLNDEIDKFLKSFAFIE